MRHVPGVLAVVPLALVLVGAKGPDLTDPEVAHVAVTANAIDVEMARLALDRSENAQVRGFAERMVTDHTAVNERAAALAQRLGVTPRDNDVSRSLREGASSARARLEGLRGSAFDRAYMEREVAYHEAVIGAVDDVLLPTTENEELAGLLREVRPALVAHLERARSILRGLGGAR